MIIDLILSIQETSLPVVIVATTVTILFIIASWKVLLYSGEKGKTNDIHSVEKNVSAPTYSKYEVVSGIRIRYSDSGNNNDNSKVTLVMVHGFLGCLETWKLLTERLDTKFRVISLDLVGNGFSDKPIDGSFKYSLQNQGNIVSEFIEKLNLSKTIVVGHSSGGIVVTAALAAAMNKAEADGNDCRVRGIVLVAPGFYRTKSSLFSYRFMRPLACFLLRRFLNNYEKFLKRNPSNFTPEIIQHFINATRTQHFFEALVQSVTTKERPYIEELRDVLVKAARSMKVNKDIDVVRIVWADNDTVNPPHIDKINSLVVELWSKQFVSQIVIDNSFHYIQYDQPTKLAGEIEEFAMKFVQTFRE